MLNLVHLAAQRSFAHFTLWRGKPNGGWEFNFIDIAGFLTSRGYFLFRTCKQKHILIRILDNIVTEVGKKDLKDEILNFVKKEEPAYIYEFFLKNIAKCVNDEFLETLPAKDVQFKKDQKDAMQIYFQNCIVKVTKEGIKTYGYDQLNGYIWESQIIQRKFDDSAESGSDFKTFCWNVSAEDNNRYASLCSAIGYFIHNYKNPSYSPAVILNDEVISDNPEGGTGKGIIFKALKYYMNIVNIDGKIFSFDKGFLYSRISDETRLICFQDVKQNFDFERLFSVITEGIITEKKGKDEVFLEFEQSPKIGITTNYAIRGAGNSHERRRHEVEIAQYYFGENTPEKEFGKMMFSDWSQEEWKLFDAFIIECCQFYLLRGLVKQELKNLPEKKLTAETSREFLEFMEDQTLVGAIPKKDLFDKFLYEYENYKKNNWMTKNLFTKWLTKYCTYHKINFDPDYRNASGRCYKFDEDF